MARKKVTLAYINKESERKASYKKRKKGLIKKVEELSTLCGIDACAVIYSEFQPQPKVWPSPPEARRVLTRFMELSDMEKTWLMENQMSFMRQRIEKARNKLPRLQREKKRKELTIFMFQCIKGKVNIQDFDVRTWRDECGYRRGSEVYNREDEAAGEGPSSAAAATGEELKAAGEGSSTAAMKGEEVAVQPGFVDENENLAGFSYWNMLMNSTDGCADWGWNDEPMPLPPNIPSTNPNAASAPGSSSWPGIN